MAKHKGYAIAKKLILSGDVKTFRELIDVVPKTAIAKDLGMHLQTFSKMLAQPQLFTFKVAYRIASLLDVDEKTVLDLIHAEHLLHKKTVRKSK
jgi:plasmid maintenance system antidote protein VapI